MQQYQHITTTLRNASWNRCQAWRASGQRVLVGLIVAMLLMGVTTRAWAADGALDASFGSGGKVTTDFFGEGFDDEGTAVALQPDGKIVVAGYAENATTNNDFAVARYVVQNSYLLWTK